MDSLSKLGNIPPIVINPDEILEIPTHKRLNHVLKGYLKGGETIAKVELIKYVTGALIEIVDSYSVNPIVTSYLKLIKTGMSVFELTTIVSNIIQVSGQQNIISNSLESTIFKVIGDNYFNGDEDNVRQYTLGGSEYNLLKANIYALSNKTCDEFNIEVILKECVQYDSISTTVVVGKCSGTFFTYYDEHFIGDTTFTDYRRTYLYIETNDQDNSTNYMKVIGTLNSAMNKVFYEKINPAINYVIIDKNGYNIHEKIKIKADIRNLDYPPILKSMKYCISNSIKRGYIFVGNPGVGKTLVLHKIIGDFNDVPTFIVKNECLTSAEDIRSVFAMIKSFNAILIFDDFDGLDISEKNYITNEILYQLDMNGDYHGITIATINDPSKVNYTLMNRAGRFDEVHLMELPKTLYDVEYVLGIRLSEVKIPAMDTSDIQAFLHGCLDNNFTHARIASCVDYSISRHMTVTPETLLEAMNAAIMFTMNAKMFSNNGELTSDIKTGGATPARLSYTNTSRTGYSREDYVEEYEISTSAPKEASSW